MTPAEVADYFQVSRQTIWRWRREGRISAVKIGRTVRFSRSEIEALLAPEPERAA